MHIPQGHQVVMSYLILDKAQDFMAFTQKVFNAIVTVKQEDPDGALRHCEIQIGGCTIMFAGATDQWQPRNGDQFIYVADADETYKLALANGGTTVMELSDQSYGRTCGIADPSGNTWWITSVK